MDCFVAYAPRNDEEFFIVIVGLDPTICTSQCCTDSRVKHGNDTK